MNHEREGGRIYQEIHRRIAEFEYKPGEQLREKRLMEEFGTSRTPIRDAFILLAGEGLLTIIPNSGTFVTKSSFKEMMEAYEVRLNLVELSGKLAAYRIGKEELKECELLVGQMEEEGDPKKIIKMDSLCHELINKATRNRELMGILKNLKIKSLSIWEYPVEEQYYQSIAADFKSIFLALQKRDGEKSGALLKAHVKRIMDHIKREM